MEQEKKEKNIDRGEMVMTKCYEALIQEKNGIIENIAYKCNRKDKCCDSEICGTECQHTLNKEYAVDIGNEKDKQVIETKIYADGNLIKKIVEYR